MKIALINGSSKVNNSASENILNSLKQLFPVEHEIIEKQFRVSNVSNQDLEQLAECNVLVFAFPLYVDGLPSHLINCLYQLETFLSTLSVRNILVYSLVNCGFYEGNQANVALEIMKNWCEKANLIWCQGIGIGGGGMLPSLKGIPEGKGPKKNLYEALNTIAISICTCTSADNIYISPNFPRFTYKLSAEMGWRQQAKANGLKTKDLFTRVIVQTKK